MPKEVFESSLQLSSLRASQLPSFDLWLFFALGSLLHAYEMFEIKEIGILINLCLTPFTRKGHKREQDFKGNPVPRKMKKSW